MRVRTELVLNTSFNVKGQPIVNTPEEALSSTLRSSIGSMTSPPTFSLG